MLKFKQIIYKNIGPFANQTKTVQFGNGKFLIKAPIGSGKSFLYFDGPTYALYKRSGRKMVNTNCKTGKIILEFEAEGVNYKVERSLKEGKSKDSCKSKFWIEGEEVIFKNETDLQGNIESILPPREVFLATFVLMQDAPNIFELQAQDRLEIFKHIFNLLGIDEGKEILGEKKRDLYTKIKVLQDTSKYDEKLNLFLEKLTEVSSGVKFDFSSNETERSLNNENKEDSSTSSEGQANVSTFIEEITPFLGKLTCKDFSFNLKGNEFDELKSDFEKKKKELMTLKANFENKNNNYKYKLEEKTSKKDFLLKISSEIVFLENKIKSFDQDDIDKKKHQKKAFLDEQNKIDQSILQLSSLRRQGSSEKDTITTEFLSSELGQPNSIQHLWEHIQHQIQQGKDLKLEKDKLEMEIKLIEQKELEKKRFEEDKREKIKDLKKRIEEAKKELTNFDSMIDEQNKFQCEKIDGLCPFIKVINKKTFENLNIQRLSLEEKINVLGKKLIECEKEMKNRMSSGVQSDFSSDEIEGSLQINIKKDSSTAILDTSSFRSEGQIKLEKLQNQITKTNKQISNIKEFLTKIDRQLRKEKYDKYQYLNTQIKDIDYQITQKEELSKQIETHKQTLAGLQGQIEQEQKNIIQIDEELEKTQKEAFLLKEKIEIKEDENKNVQKAENNISEYEKVVGQISNLLSDFKSVQMETKKVREDYQIMSDLYFVFSKELLLIVLQESIPVLNEIVNAYLAEVVDYQIKMSIIPEGEKFALEILVIDKLGEREVKALSGGQKVVLKIAWMLAVASYMKTSMLFLDETINNLDADSISGVAEMLENFIKQQQIDLYVVTHSSHIQAMDIWDEVIEIEKN